VDAVAPPAVEGTSDLSSPALTAATGPAPHGIELCKHRTATGHPLPIPRQKIANPWRRPRLFDLCRAGLQRPIEPGAVSGFAVHADRPRRWVRRCRDNPSVRIERICGSATELVGQPFPEVLPTALVQVFGLSRSALILGSGQKESIADLPAAEAAGVDVARRRSGGGAALLAGGA